MHPAGVSCPEEDLAPQGSADPVDTGFVMKSQQDPSSIRSIRALLAGLLVGFPLVLAGCNVSVPGETPNSRGPGWRPDIPVSQPPFEEVHVQWKDRLAQPYVYIEHIGSYLDVGPIFSEVLASMRAQGLEPSGAPFALYYDDPGQVPIAQLRARACIPVNGASSVEGKLRPDVLPSGTVVYAFAAGAYPEVPRSYPALQRFLVQLGWRRSGPVREVYLVNPKDVTDWSELVTEVQFPAVAG